MNLALRGLLIAPYPLRRAPSQRFRFEQYLDGLARVGIHLDVRPLLDDAEMDLIHRGGHTLGKMQIVARGALRRIADLRAARTADFVFIHREAFPLGFPWFERALTMLGRPYLFDFDDSIYLPNSSASNRLFRPLKYAEKTSAIVRSAAAVIAGNEFLGKWARALNSRVHVIPTTIDTTSYRPRPPSVRERVCLGWTGSLTTFPHLLALAPLLGDLQAKTGIRIRLIGHADFRLPSAQVEVLPWREATELEDLSGIDIGIMPLPDDAWANGKCGLKALQYMALGIPAVMSPVGVNVDIASRGAAILASTSDEWRTALVDLIRDPVARARLGATGRRRVEDCYSVTSQLPRYVEAIRSMMA